jgi:hypothetical protein
MSYYNEVGAQHQPRPRVSVNRRHLLRGAIVAGGFAVAGIGGLGIAQAQNGTHPGLLHTQADLDRMHQKVYAREEPWISGWNRLIANSHSWPGWTPRPVATVVRGGGTGENYSLLYNDLHAAYQNALRWRIQNNTNHRDTAVNILNAWSGTLQEITGSADRWLAAGIYGYQAANAAELVRDAPGFDRGRFQSMLRNIF